MMRLRGFVTAVVGVLLMCGSAWALQADELLLIANKNVPEGVKLAQYYAKRRGVPENQILLLTLPNAEDVTFDQYEVEIVPAIRKFMREGGLDLKVRCLVTFYGVPFRIGQRPETPALQAERTQVDQELGTIRPKMEATVVGLEDLARKQDGEFVPRLGLNRDPVTDLSRRANDAAVVVYNALSGIVNKQKKEDVTRQLSSSFMQLAGTGAWLEHMTDGAQLDPNSQAGMKYAALASVVERAKQKATELKENRGDPDARHALRRIVKENFGLLEYTRLLSAQSEYLKLGDTTAALDSELSLLEMDYYPRNSWLPNYLRYDMPPQQAVQMLMVMRMDAPEPSQVTDMILASMKIEQVGLTGRIIVDSRGIPANDPKQGGYGVYDEHVRQLAKFIKAKTKMPLMWDDKPEVITLPPGAPKIKDVALYCGWYQVGGMAPIFDFKPGSVGFHIASFTMQHLHEHPNWTGQMLKEGISATLGAVNEPYVTAFPNPDDFFPLLLTGKLTLAEVYWKTVPWTSWQICMIGDPLYTPFEKNPQVLSDDLPPRLRRALQTRLAPAELAPAIRGPATAPHTSAPAPAAATQGIVPGGR
jgi:uncharacterized protein (TIGR03790 family)